MPAVVLVPTRSSAKSFVGFSIDGFPVNPGRSSTVYFTDTDQNWIYDGSGWVQITPADSVGITELVTEARNHTELLLEILAVVRDAVGGV